MWRDAQLAHFKDEIGGVVALFAPNVMRWPSLSSSAIATAAWRSAVRHTASEAITTLELKLFIMITLDS